MAHIEKYKRAQVAPMIRHYERTMGATLERDNIDASRTRLNYEIADTEQPHIDMEDLVAQLVELHNAHGRAIRSDAVVMADLVITMPKGFPEERAVEFFAKAADFAEEFWAPAICPQGYVHMDESQPHMHLPIIPFDPEAQRFRARDIITRGKLRQMHGQMEQYLRRELGMERVGVELTKQERGQRELEYTGLKAYQEARDELARVRQEASREQSRADHERNRADAYAAQAKTAGQELAKAKELVATTKDEAQGWEQTRDANKAQAEAWDQTRAANQAAAEQEQQRLESLRRGCGEQEAEIGRLDERIRAAEQQQRERQQDQVQQSVGSGPAEQAQERPEPEQAPGGLRGLVKLAQREVGEGGGLGERERAAEAEQQAQAERARELDEKIAAARELHSSLQQRYQGRLAGLAKLEERTRDVEKAIAGLRERVEGSLERLVERLRDLTRTMGLERASERFDDLFVERIEFVPSGLNDAVARGLGSQECADEIVPERWEYGYDGPDYEPEYEYEQEYEAPSIGRDLGWDR